MDPISTEEAKRRLLWSKQPDQGLSNFIVIQSPGDPVQMQILA